MDALQRSATMPYPIPSNWTTIGLRIDTGSAVTGSTFWMDGLQIELGNVATTWMPGGTAPFLVRQGEVIIYDANGNRIFGGYATDFQDKTEYTRVKTQVTCSDYWQDLARVVINQIYTSEYDNQILDDLFENYAPTIDLSDWNQVSTYLFTKIYLRAKTLQESVQQIADTVGFDVWVDPYKKFQYKSPSNSGTAPFAVSDNPDFITSFPSRYPATRRTTQRSSTGCTSTAARRHRTTTRRTFPRRRTATTTPSCLPITHDPLPQPEQWSSPSTGSSTHWVLLSLRVRRTP